MTRNKRNLKKEFNKAWADFVQSRGVLADKLEDLHTAGYKRIQTRALLRRLTSNSPSNAMHQLIKDLEKIRGGLEK